jgi:two-component system OmpR family response regulator
MTSKDKRLLVVDDDSEIRELLTKYLTRNSFEVRSVEDGEALFSIIENWEPDLIILDVMLPGEDGFILCQKLRRKNQVPIIMLTASAEETDRIVGLEMGADDYLAKPFNPRELLARIKAILRRAGNTPAGASYESPVPTPLRFHFGGRKLDVTNRMLTFADGRQVTLSGADYKLLLMFLRAGNEMLGRDEISEALHGRDCSPYDRSIDVAISRLRQRLEDNAKTPRLILTHRGTGYVLAVNVDADYSN